MAGSGIMYHGHRVTLWLTEGLCVSIHPEFAVHEEEGSQGPLLRFTF
jgi:hypothetical protein